MSRKQEKEDANPLIYRVWDVTAGCWIRSGTLNGRSVWFSRGPAIATARAANDRRDGHHYPFVKEPHHEHRLCIFTLNDPTESEPIT